MDISKIHTDRKEAVTFLYNTYGKKFYGYAVSKWNISEDDAWDLVYKTLYRFLEVASKYQFENERKLGNFLFTIFINYLRNHYNKNKDQDTETVELNETHGNISADTNEATADKSKSSPAYRCLEKVLQTFQDWQRILLLMRAQDFPYEKIAAFVEKPADQLKVYHARLKKSVTEQTKECVENS